ncbi:MAG: hypothetical protein M1830_000240 [Pleopsidium flavum]|nr:MAG: hypothetical protein M1830_000240 [Pleopsidium flavum]
MSTELDPSPAPREKAHKKEKVRYEKKGEKKRKRDDYTEPQHLPSKKSRAETSQNTDVVVEQPSTPSGSIEASPFHIQTSSLYLPLSPISQLYPLKGLCAEHLSPLILTYYPPFHGVLLSYSNVQLSENPSTSTSSAGKILARSVDEYAVNFIWVTADFLIFEPQRGGWIEGWINLQNEGHLGLVCWNLFNASIERKWLPKTWNWIGAHKGPEQENKHKKRKNTQETTVDGVDEGEGYFEDADRQKIEGAIRFRVRDMESSPTSEKEKGFLSIEGSLLSEEIEMDLLAQERTRGKGEGRSRRVDGLEKVMSGGLAGPVIDTRLPTSEPIHAVFCAHAGDGLIIKGLDPTVSAELKARKTPPPLRVAYRLPAKQHPLHLEVEFSKRHALPPTQVLWTVTNLRPPYTAAGSSGTISQLLEQVNEVIPLESEHWGLEDYVVEVQGFECLHFSELTTVLKEEDQVSIRPLQTYDLRSRKLSGRHQISYDGKHLIDGVAFGRPFLRLTDRPAISIPPRKRRRLMHGDDGADSTGGAVSDGQVVLRADFFNTDEDKDDSEQDEQFVHEDDDETALADELRDLQRESDNMLGVNDHQNSQSPNRAMHLLESGKSQGRLTRSRQGVHELQLDDGKILKLIDEHGRPYPGEYRNALLDYYTQDHVASETTPGPTSKRRKRVARALNVTPKVVSSITHASKGSNRRSSTDSVKSVRFEEPGYDASGASLTVEEDESNDEDFRPDGPIDSDEESDKENFEPRDPLSDSSTVSSESESESSDTSSSLSSSSSSSSNEDGSDSEPEEASSHKKDTTAAKEAIGKTLTADSSEKASQKQQEYGHSPGRNVPPGQGQAGTRKRNQRRRDHKKIEYLKKVGLLPSHATRQDYMLWEKTSKTPANMDEAQQPVDFQSKKLDERREMERKRKELLESIASGGVEMGRAEANPSTEPTEVSTGNADAIMHESPDNQAQTPAIASESPLSKETASEPPRRRAKLDLASSRRLLFGSLGLRTPKTKDDEQTMREKLMEQARPATSGTDVQASKASMDVGTRIENELWQGDDSWKSKVIVKAVECCHDGVELSTPPFPFVQRWDPQQRGAGKAGSRGGKTKKRKRNQPQYHQEGEEQYDFQDALEVQHGNGEAALEPKNDDPGQTPPEQRPDSDEIDGAVNDQLMRDADGISATAPENVEEPKDLPMLPQDISSIASLVKEHAVPGAIIAFKQLDMSQETNWQPKISDFRTAVIDKVVDDETLQMTLSKRDRSKKDKKYDEETGERIYTKFEMPDYDDEGAGEDDGFIEVFFMDLIEPMLVQAAKTQSASPSEQQHAAHVSHDTGNTDIVEDAKNGMQSDQGANLTAEEAEKVLYDDEPLEVNEEVRKEILKLMKDVGFRSSVGPEVVPTDQEGNGEVNSAPKDHNKRVSENNAQGDSGSPSSPKFNGFGSSPAPEEEDNGPSPSPYRETSSHRKSGSPSSNINTHIGGAGSSDDRNLNIQQNAQDGLRNDNPMFDEDEQEQLANGSEGASDTIQAGSSKRLQRLFTSSSPPVAASAIRRSRKTSFKPNNKSIGGHDGASSDNDFPSLDTVFSTARSSVETSAPNRNGKQRLPSGGKADPTSLPRQKASLDVYLANEAFDDASTPRPSQVPPGSQIVDLTLSSDPVNPVDDDSEYHEGSELPSGSGWVNKRKTRSAHPSTALGKRSIGRLRKNRSL